MGTPLAVQPSNTLSTATNSPSITRKVGTPKVNGATATTSTSAAKSTGGIVGNPISQPGFLSQHSISHVLSNSAVLVIIIFSVTIFVTLGALLVWRVHKYRNQNKNNRKDIEDEDALEAYSKYWKGKRNSGGNTAQQNHVSSPVDEKGGNNTHV